MTAELPNLMAEGMRWFGPGNDPVSLADIRQAGARAVFTALHLLPYGAVWTREAIRERKDEVASAGLSWRIVESVPVSDDIKTWSGDAEAHCANYRASIENLAAEGIDVVVFNFMPLLDWVRTSTAHELPSGAQCLSFDMCRFAAFDIHMLQRPRAASDYPDEVYARAAAFNESLSRDEREAFIRGIIDIFPGCKKGLTLDDVRRMLSRYAEIDTRQLKNNLQRFLEAVVPTAEACGVRLAIHPDDPPFTLMGLPRVVSTEADLADVLAMVPSPANGLCFCTGSLSPRAENDLVGLVRRFGKRIHAVHLRNVARLGEYGFHEADHLNGVVDMYAVVRALLDEQCRRKAEGRVDWQLTFRPDHGHLMLDDLRKPPNPMPGYGAIGRLRGLAELRGLQLGIARSMDACDE